MKKKGWKLPLGILFGSAWIVLAEIWRELHGFCTRRYTVYTEKVKKSVKITFLSDLHGKMYGPHNQKLIQAVSKEKPDAILIGGDMVTRTDAHTDQTALELVQELSKIAPIYMANGNHEQKMKERSAYYKGRYKAYREELEKLGVTMLENCSCQVEIKGEIIEITGLEVPLRCYGHFSHVPVSKSEIEARIGAPRQMGYQILLAHTPAYIKSYLEWGADMVLCGHLHGGIIRLPLIGGVITPQAELFPRYSGDIYKEGGQCSIVSRGLGTHTINLRYLNQAELVAVTIAPERSTVKGAAG